MSRATVQAWGNRKKKPKYRHSDRSDRHLTINGLTVGNLKQAKIFGVPSEVISIHCYFNIINTSAVNLTAAEKSSFFSAHDRTKKTN